MTSIANTVDSITALTPIDINKEFSLLVELIGKLWDGCDTEAAQSALKASFQKGLEDGKLWIDQYATMRIAQQLNGNDKICFPLNARREMVLDGDDSAYLYDALCTFDSHLSNKIGHINSSVTSWGRWDYSKNADALVAKLNLDYPSLVVTPKDQDHATQKAIVDAYAGLDASEAGSYPTPQRLLKTYAEYSRDEQGLSLFRSLFSAVYSHALYCAKEYNTQSLVRDLMPIYVKRDEALNFDNGGEILSIALNNPFVEIIQKIEPFTFYSSNEYRADKEAAKARSLSPETEEQKKARMDAMLDKMLDGIDERIKAEESRANAIIDEIAPSFPFVKLK